MCDRVLQLSWHFSASPSFYFQTCLGIVSFSAKGFQTCALPVCSCVYFFFFQAEDGIRDLTVTGVQTCALPICIALNGMAAVRPEEWRGLFERAREGGTASTESAANGLHGVAAAVGAAHAGQSLGQQAAGQNGAAFAQPDAQAQPGNSTEREQQVSEQVAFWVHNKNQNASLSVEHEGRAIQVQVSLQGNEAHVRFGASEAQARDWLGNGADQLRELLQAQGLQLAGVSVDAGGQSGSGDSARQGADAQARQGRVSAMVDADR